MSLELYIVETYPREDEPFFLFSDFNGPNSKKGGTFYSEHGLEYRRKT